MPGQGLQGLNAKVPVKIQDVTAFKSENRVIISLLKMINGLSGQLLNLKQGEKRIDQNDQINAGTPVFCFAEYTSRVLRDTYCYQDLTADYLFRLRKSKNPLERFTPTRGVVPAFLLRRKVQKAKVFYENCAGVFTMSQWLKEDLIHNSGVPANKVHHVGGGCNIDTALIDISEKKGNRFLFIGKDWERKNGDLVVTAFEMLLHKCPDKAPELFVAGPSEKPASLRGKDHIHYLGLLSHAELAQYYNMCDYFVMPSEFEAYGLVFAEALCFGLPCIGKNCFAMPEFIRHGENGYLIEQSDPRELCDAMKELLLNGQKIAHDVQAQRDVYIQKYSWSSVADRILETMSTDGY